MLELAGLLRGPDVAIEPTTLKLTETSVIGFGDGENVPLSVVEMETPIGGVGKAAVLCGDSLLAICTFARTIGIVKAIVSRLALPSANVWVIAVL